MCNEGRTDDSDLAVLIDAARGTGGTMVAAGTAHSVFTRELPLSLGGHFFQGDFRPEGEGKSSRKENSSNVTFLSRNSEKESQSQTERAILETIATGHERLPSC